MSPFTRNFLPALVVLALSACDQRKDLTTEQVKAVAGLGQDGVRARLGMPTVVTNGGALVWWQYDGVNDNGMTVSCHIIFKGAQAQKIAC